MTDEKEQEVCFTVIPTIQIIIEESEPIRSRSTSDAELPEIVQDERSVPPPPPPRIPKLSYHVPPDTLMFPLFSAIQRRAWVRAQRLCYELIQCDPERKSYLNLYLRLEQITYLIDRRRHPRSIVRQATAASSDRENSSRQQSQ